MMADEEQTQPCEAKSQGPTEQTTDEERNTLLQTHSSIVPSQDTHVSTIKVLIFTQEPVDTYEVKTTNTESSRDQVKNDADNEVMIVGDIQQVMHPDEVDLSDELDEINSVEVISDSLEDISEKFGDICDPLDDVSYPIDDMCTTNDVIDPSDDITELDTDKVTPDMANRPGSLPFIQMEGDHNANTILDHKWSVSNPLMHLTPRREGRIVLPKRYMDLLNAYKQQQAVSSPSPKESPSSQNSPVYLDIVSTSNPSDVCNKATEEPGYTEHSPTRTHDPQPEEPRPNTISDKLSDRLGDLDVALKWIRQEVLQFKQEDRFLTRRLLDLRARIHQIQGLPTHLSLSSNLAFLGSCGSDMDVATWSSFLSLDERALRRSSEFTDNPSALKELLLSFQDRSEQFHKPNSGTLGRGLRGFGTGSGLGDTLSRSASTREPIKPPPRKRKNSLPMANELEEDHFFDEDDSD